MKRRRFINFMIRVLMLPRSHIDAWTDIQNHGTRFELRLMEYDLVTMSEFKVMRLKQLIEELHFVTANKS